MSKDIYIYIYPVYLHFHLHWLNKNYANERKNYLYRDILFYKKNTSYRFSLVYNRKRFPRDEKNVADKANV